MAYKQSILWKTKSIGVAMVERYISTRMSYPISILIIGNEAWLRIDLQLFEFPSIESRSNDTPEAITLVWIMSATALTVIVLTIMP